MASMLKRIGAKWTAAVLRLAGIVCLILALSKITFVHGPGLLLLFGIWLLFEGRQLSSN